MQSSTLPATEATGRLPPGTTILQVLPALGHGGVERGTIEMARAIVAAGGRALVVAEAGPNVARLLRVGGEHVAMPVGSKNPLTILRNRRRLATLIAAERVSLIHVRSRAPAWSAIKAAKRAGVPVVTTYHGSYSEPNWFKRRYNRVMVSGDKVIAISQFIADLIRQRYGTSDEQIRLVHRGADLSVFAPSAVGPARVTKLIRQWGIGEATRVVLLPGRLTRWKGQGVLIEAFAKLWSQHDVSDVAVVLAGSDQGRDAYHQELVRLVKSSGLDGRQIVFADHCDDMPAAMLLADVVVSASTRPEAFGRTMAEAAAMGKPVITTNHGAAPEIVVPDITGWLVPPGDPQALAGALSKALSLSPEERARMVEAAIARVEQHFSVEVMCAKTLRVYREMLSNRAG
jgi:glycosyltransferase involved in cell wall biosynthesis